MKVPRWAKRILGGAIAFYLLGFALLYFGQSLFIFHPHSLEKNYQYEFEGQWEEHWLTAPDGTALNSLLFKARNSQGVVLYLHGNTGNIDRCSRVKERFLRNQQDVLFLDYRGFGKSQGDLDFEGMHSDVKTAYDFLVQLYPASKITIYGQSLGSGMATWLAAQQPSKALILEAPYTSIADVAGQRFFMYPVDWVLEYPFSCAAHVAKVDCPVWVFHGTNDGTIPYEQGSQIAQLAQDGTLLSLEGGSHVDQARFGLYQETLDFILKQP